MQRYEYKVTPAPLRAEKARGVRTTADRFALALTTLMNRMGAEGWEYVRADTLPCEERVGLTGRQTTFQHMLVFRRALLDAAPMVPAMPEPRTVAPAVAEPAPAPAPAPVPPAAVTLPAPDPMDDAARRAGMVPPVARPVFGATPRVVAAPDAGLPFRRGPAVGPANSALRATKEGEGA